MMPSEKDAERGKIDGQQCGMRLDHGPEEERAGEFYLHVSPKLMYHLDGGKGRGNVYRLGQTTGSTVSHSPIGTTTS